MSAKGASFLGGVWEHAPQKVLKFRRLEMQFSPFSRQYLGLIRTIKIKYVYYSRSFPQNLNHWLLEKSEGGLGASPPEIFEIEMPGNVIFTVFETVLFWALKQSKFRLY